MLQIAIHATGVQDVESLPFEGRVFEVDGTSALGAKVSQQRVATYAVGVEVCVDLVFSFRDVELGFHEAVIVCECRAGRLLAVAAMAENWTLVDTRDTVGHRVAQAGPGCCGGGHGGARIIHELCG